LIVGVDGGATKTVAWVTDLEGRVLGRGLGGPGNPRSIGFSEAERHVDTAVASAFADAGIARRPAARAGLSLAGVGRVEERDEIRAWAERAGIARVVVVTDDAESVLAAGAPEGWGVALVSGTGTLAVGRNDRGESARAGGWGYLLGDEGGAYWIALAGLRAAMRANDGVGPPTSLTGALVAALDLERPSDLVARIYGPDMSRDRIGLLASTVFDEAVHDTVATQVIDFAASALATLVSTIVTRLGLPPGDYPLAAAGSVLSNREAFRQQVLEKLDRAGHSPRIVRVVSEPVAGAIRLAMDQ
jgi:N-acetylglucosamine kinase-like BadF-type ATPase